MDSEWVMSELQVGYSKNKSCFQNSISKEGFQKKDVEISKGHGIMMRISYF